MKITYDDAAYILGYKEDHPIRKHLLSWELRRLKSGGAEINGYVKWPFYILIFIPYIIASTVYNIWDVGLRHGEYILDRNAYCERAARFDYAGDRIRDRFPDFDSENA